MPIKFGLPWLKGNIRIPTFISLQFLWSYNMNKEVPILCSFASFSLLQEKESILVLLSWCYSSELVGEGTVKCEQWKEIEGRTPSVPPTLSRVIATLARPRLESGNDGQVHESCQEENKARQKQDTVSKASEKNVRYCLMELLSQWTYLGAGQTSRWPALFWSSVLCRLSAGCPCLAPPQGTSPPVRGPVSRSHSVRVHTGLAFSHQLVRRSHLPGTKLRVLVKAFAGSSVLAGTWAFAG